MLIIPYTEKNVKALFYFFLVKKRSTAWNIKSQAVDQIENIGGTKMYRLNKKKFLSRSKLNIGRILPAFAITTILAQLPITGFGSFFLGPIHSNDYSGTNYKIYSVVNSM